MDLTEILTMIISLAVALTTAFLIPYLKTKFNTEQLAELNTWVNIAVSAAEQLFNSGEGRAKKQYVLNFLESKGYKVCSDDIDKMIEGAVNKLTKALRE